MEADLKSRLLKDYDLSVTKIDELNTCCYFEQMIFNVNKCKCTEVLGLVWVEFTLKCKLLKFKQWKNRIKNY